LPPPAQTHPLPSSPQTFISLRPGNATQSGDVKAARCASRRSEENSSGEKPSSDTPRKRNPELPTVCPFRQLFLPLPPSARLHLLPSPHLTPAKRFSYQVIFQRKKSSTSSLINNLSPPCRRHHGANPEDTLLLKGIILLSSPAPPKGLCQPYHPPSPGPPARSEPSISTNRLQMSEEQRAWRLPAAQALLQAAETRSPLSQLKPRFSPSKFGITEPSGLSHALLDASDGG